MNQTGLIQVNRSVSTSNTLWVEKHDTIHIRWKLWRMSILADFQNILR